MSSENHIDIYCERLDGSFWAEPINAISNIAFLVAAFAAYILWRKSAKSLENLALIAIATCVGVGSFAFHTFATFPAMLADIIPIIIFIHLALTLTLKRVFGLSWRTSLLMIAAFLGGNIALKSSAFAPLLNGSMQYVPTLFALFVLCIIAFANKKYGATEFAIAGIAFLFALTFRSVDMHFCEILPLGTHFMWHTLNPVAMYCTMRVLIKTSNKTKA